MRIVKKYLVTTLLLAVVASGPAVADEDMLADLHEMKSLISSINLLNGLHLGGDQLRQLLQLNLEAEQLRRDYYSERQALIAEAAGLYRTLLDNYAGDRRAPEDSERRAAELNHRLTEDYKGYQERLAELGDRLEALLTAGQRQTVYDFKPCLIPPRDLREPSRAGQASSSDRSEVTLSRYRDLMRRAEEIERRAAARQSGRYNRYGRSRYRYNPQIFASNRARDAFADRYFPRYFEILERINGEMTEEERSAERRRVLEILDRGAAMGDEEFALSSGELAGELSTPIEAGEEEMRRAMSVLARRHGSIGRAARFLIRPDLIPVLDDRLRQRDAAEAAAQ